ncbi:Calx-beta domain-containing protein [Parasphingorhabdus sp. DH2-15]|uniref:Calx-beta domain-containing protein n=1 Tax=Parasphingorhabdus sp. DH2-15 TaxID=3444112 RepID=UPI003F684CC9
MKTGDVSGTYSVNWYTSDGSTEGAADYGVADGTAVFAPDVNEIQISIATIDDSEAEGQETFYINLNGTSGGAGITDMQATANISDNDSGNTPPVASDDLLIAPRCTVREINLVANDTDQDGNTPLSVVQGSLSGDGAAFTDHHPDPSKTATRVQITAPNVASRTNYTVTYQVQDTLGATDTGTLTINVRAFGDTC